MSKYISLIRFWNYTLIFFLWALFLPKSAYGMFTSHSLPTQSLLPVANIHCIFQDSEGYMWYGTTGGGLCRDNGYQIDVFQANGQLANNVRCIAEDNLGNIWFGTEKRLYRLSKQTYQLQEVFPGKDTYISSLFLDSHKNMWVTTSQGIYCMNPKNEKILFHNKSIKHASQFLEDSSHHIWIATWEGGPCRYDDVQKKIQKMPWNFPFGVCRMVEDTTQKGFWIATWGGGIVFYDAQNWRIIPQPQTASSTDMARCLDMLIDKKQGLVWVTTLDNLYLYRRVGRQLTATSTADFLSPGRKILDEMCEDRNGNIWVSGFIPHTFIVSSPMQFLKRETVAEMSQQTGFPLLADRMVADGEGYWIWQGRIGLMHWQQNPSRLKMAGGWRFAKCIAKDKQNPGIWAAEKKCLKHIEWYQDNGKEMSIVHFPSNITSIIDNGDGTLLIGTEDGIYSYSVMGKAMKRIVKSHHQILTMATADNGSIYFIDALRRLYSYRADTKLYSNQAKRISYSYQANGKLSVITNSRQEGFSALSVAPDGTLWCSSLQGSVFSMRPDQHELTYQKQISSTNKEAINDIKVDGTGHVWLLSEQYLREYNPRNNAFRRMRNTDADINLAYFKCLETIDDHMIGVGGMGAYLEFESSKMLDRQNAALSQPTITSVQMGDSILLLNDKTSRIDIPKDETSVVLKCTTFDPLHASKISFAYKVEGWGKEWIYLPQGVNSISLSNLPKGKHRLSIKATDCYGCWSDSVSEYILYHHLAWWETWWAYLIYIMLACLGGYGLWRLNKRIQLLRILQEKHKNLTLKEVQVKPEELNADKPHSEEFIKLLIESIESHLGDNDYGVEQLSSDMCMSRMSLYRKVQTLCGLSPNEFIKDVRLKKAASILQKHPTIPIGVLASKVGFATPKYFSKCFKEKFGVLPSQYEG